MTMSSRAGITVSLILCLGATAGGQDTVRVRADGLPRWGPDVRLVQEVAIGVLDGPPEYSFGRITAGAMEPGGGFYLFDFNDRRIRRYDRSGRFLNHIGMRGGGPGEYQSASGLAVTRDGLVIVLDPGNSRITYFNPDGPVQRDFPLLRSGFYGDNFVTDTAGLIYLTLPVGTQLQEGPGSRQQFVRLTPDGAVRDSILLPDRYMPADAPRSFFLSTSDGMRWNFVERRLTAPYLPGGVLSGTSHAYRFAVTVPGKPVLVVERRHTPVPLGAAERADWLAWVEYFRTNPGGPPVQYQVPRTKPPIRALASDHLGRVWVEVFVPAEKRHDPPRPAGDPRPLLTWKERTTYDVFSPGGEYLGRVGLPAETVILAIRDNRILVRGKGPDGEDRVLVYRMAVRGNP